MALVNTINFLPDVFKSATNQRFLGATLDQLATDAYNVPINGYIGRTFAPTYKLGDNYIPESSTNRTNYQLEPSVVVRDNDKNVVLNSDYQDLTQNIANNNGFTNNHQRLFSSEYYNYNGYFDYDKFVNYNSYFWMPNGPASVAITAGDTPYLADYTVTRNTTIGGYTFTGQSGQPNTQLTLTRGGTYTFKVDQPGHNFWIQSQPGLAGAGTDVSAISTRNVFGVSNNGTDNGTVRFNVPLENAQDFYSTLSIVSTVNAVATFGYTDIQNQLLSTFLTNFPLGLDGVTNLLQGKTFIFVNDQIDPTYWTTPTDPFVDTSQANPTIGVISSDTRSNVWQINLVPSGSDFVIQIKTAVNVSPLDKIFVGSGKTYASAQFWLDNNHRYNIVPLITANADYLYYQDSSNPGFVGTIKLVDNQATPIDINKDIIGKKGYTSPNGIIFTNGLKVQFDALVTPAEYAGQEYYVEGVGRSIQLVSVSQLSVPESFIGLIETTPDYITINRASQDQNAWSSTNRWFHADVLIATANYNKTPVDYGPNIPGRRAIIEFEPNLQLFNFGRQAKPSVTIITFDNTDAFADIEGQTNYTLDGVPLTSGMRVIFANDADNTVLNQVWEVTFNVINSLNYLTLIPTVDDPILAGQNVLVMQGGYAGKTFWFDGTAWHECQEKTSFNQPPLFDLVDSNGYSFSDTTVYPESTFAGTEFFGYDVGSGINDPILGFSLTYQNFNNIGDIVFKNYYDTDTFTYMSSINAGTVVNTNQETVSYNSGYIVLNSGLTSSTKLNNWVKGIEPTEQYQVVTKFFEGYVLELTQPVNTIYPVNTTVPAGSYGFVQIDILPADIATIPYVKVYLNNQLLSAGEDYSIVPYGVYHVVVLETAPTIGDKIDVAIFSNSTSSIGYYEIPENLDYNPLNQNFSTITLGQLRTHYNKLIENTSISLDSTSYPLQDQYVKAQGGTLLQHSSPAIYSMTFLSDPVVNFVNGITLARKEYQRFKNKFLTLCTTLKNLDYSNPATGVDAILQNINVVKNGSFPWQFSDMVPQGGNYTTITYTVLNVYQTRYEISNIFDITALSNQAVLVYRNGVQLIANGIDFSYSANTPEIIMNITLAIGDVITIREYFDTDGSYIPETPTKLGLYQNFPPSIYTDTTYQTPIQVIRGHDGSITPTFGDFRDDYLLELEVRIYNNIKNSYSHNAMDLFDTMPGRFRSTDYSLAEWNQLLTQNFLQWTGSNNIDYTTNSWFESNNPWSWNYNQFTDAIDGSYLQGSWRAIYNYWFDTDQPHLTPWVMLGQLKKPTWWETRYGPAPYTNGNTVLWEDLEQGYVWNGSNSSAYTDERFVRPGLSKFIPVDSAGNLLPPTEIGIIRQQNPTAAANNFQVGEQGPVETAWRRGSDYPYAVMQALAVARPAEYFATQIDTSRFQVNSITGQFSNTLNQKINPTLLKVNGDSTTVTGTILRTAGYLNWVADYIKNLGMDPVAKIKQYFNNLSVQLSYKVGGFTDKRLITVTAEQTSPGSTNASIIIPPENYTVYFGKPIPIKTITYSAVVVTKTANGYSVSGYNTANPFFNVLASIASNQASSLTVNDVSVKIYQKANTTPTSIPYGTNFTSVQQVSDFLISYQRYLVSQGFVFQDFDKDLQQTRDWSLSTQEFLFWAQQGWAPGTIIVLNPVADKLTVLTTNSIIDEVANTPNGSRVVDTNFTIIKNNSFNIVRYDYPTGNRFQLATTDGTTTVGFAQLNLIQYETKLIFDNKDNFGDIIYIPEQGTRQFRLKINGSKTGLWDGALSAAGYIYSNPKINEWQPGTDYRQGDLVVYNNYYYTAPTDIVASQNFSLSNWTQISLSDIQTGLLPSFGHNAQIFQHIYDVDNPPEDKNFQVFSSGLIGFRERPFLSNLGLSVSTQTKFYQGYINQKGTHNAIDSLTKATFGTVSSTVSTYEEWAFCVGQYGDIDNNQYTEFILNQSEFLTNPVALTFTENTYNTANIIVQLAANTFNYTGNLTSNVYNAANLSTISTSLYDNRNNNTLYPKDLPTAGFVNLNDIDYQVFDITTITSIPTLVEGSTIWVAKDFGGSWNVYRASDTNLTATTLTYTLDSYAQLTFNSAHNLSVDQFFVLQGFSEYFDGLYQVIAVPNATNVTVVIQDTTQLIKTNSKLTGIGFVFTLNSVLLESYDMLGSITPLNGWIDGDRIWTTTDTEPDATGWAVYTYTEPGTWTRTRQQQDSIDITSISRTFIYNANTNIVLSSVDFIDPAKGKVLDIVGQDIDFQLTVDPAFYNAGTGTITADYHWGPEQVGKIWWDIDAVRYINYEQDQLIYRLNQWGTTFPGSQILVYEWVESSVLPSQYASVVGDGVPLHEDDSAYSTYGSVGPTGAVNIKYYYWVANKTSVNVATGKLNSVYTISAAIENPQAQGIPYATVLRNDTIALYNVNSALIGQSSVLHVSKRLIDAGLIHTEYKLVQEGNAESEIPVLMENKLIDSLAGQDAAGNPVPDPALTPAQKYGIKIRPRQTMFVDRGLALSNYLTFVNETMMSYPVVERKIMTTLNSSESVPNPDSGEYLKSPIVDSYAELLYIDTGLLSSGDKILVSADETNQGKWAIYTWDTPTADQWTMTRLQSYKTNLYWTYNDWYQTDYDPTTVPDVTVANNLEFGKLTLQPNTNVKVLNNGNNQFVIYRIDSALTKNLVGIQNGTVQISTGTIPPLEMRQIALAIQNDIFVADLAINYNKLFFLMTRYALTEQKNLDWVFKTSFISATQYLRQLQQFPSYVADNQQYYAEYINEIKPYRTTVREFVVDYQGNDQFSGDTTDFDLQPYWDANLQVYRSPNGEQSYDYSALSNTNSVYNQWYQNYKYNVVSVTVELPGSGYLFPPQITIVGGGPDVVPAEAYARLNTTGGVESVIITDPGKNYITDPTIVINGTGSGALAKAVLRNVWDGSFDGSQVGHNLIRNLNTTIKFDRINYNNPNTFVFWDSITTANIGTVIPENTILVLSNQLYQLNSQITIANLTFPLNAVTSISYSDLTNANDRITALNGNIDLAITQTGLSYPGVKVEGNTYVGNVTHNDTTIQSFYSNVFGINSSDITVDGNQYVSRFASYAPEELVPGRMFDTLDLTVYSDDQLLGNANIAFREFQDMRGNLEFFRVAEQATTVLTSNLNATDSTIEVADASALYGPSTHLNRPGVVFINGEKIVYWRNYLKETKTPWQANLTVPTGTLISGSGNVYITLGNIYETRGNLANVRANVNQITNLNTLGFLTRGVDGTYKPTVHLSNSRVVDSSITQLVPNSYPTMSNVASDVVYTSTSTVSYRLNLIGNVTANVGDYITQNFANTVVSANLFVLGNVTTANVIPVIFVSGEITTLTNTVSVNGIVTTANIGIFDINDNILGNVSAQGTVTIAANIDLQTSPSWYDVDYANNQPSFGNGLINSTTEQVTFLWAAPGIVPTPGQTP